MFGSILSWVITVVQVLPSLITDIENLWKNKPASGSSKWISVEQALSQSVQDVANTVAKLSPAGTTADEIAAACAVFAKDVSDAFVKLANDLALFPHGGQPAANAAPAAAIKK